MLGAIAGDVIMTERLFHISDNPNITHFEPRPVANPRLELAVNDVEIRILPSFWPLYDAVVNSSLQFSIIRMRNAQPR